MPTALIIACSIFWWLILIVIWACLDKWFCEFFCKHEYEEVYRADSYCKESDVDKWLKWWVDIWYVCKKCKKVKTASIEFTPINDR